MIVVVLFQLDHLRRRRRGNRRGKDSWGGKGNLQGIFGNPSLVKNKKSRNHWKTKASQWKNKENVLFLFLVFLRRPLHLRVYSGHWLVSGMGALESLLWPPGIYSGPGSLLWPWEGSVALDGPGRFIGYSVSLLGSFNLNKLESFRYPSVSVNCYITFCYPLSVKNNLPNIGKTR